MVATDGHRLSYTPVSATALLKCKTVILKSALYEVQRMNGCDSVLFAMDEKMQLFLGHQRSIVARKPTGNFPDYERVLPKEFWRTISLPVEPLAKVIQRVSVCADERSCAVKFYVDAAGQKMTVKAEQMEQTAKGSVPIIWPDEAPWVGGLNWTYCMDFLKLADGEVFFGMPECKEGGCVSSAMEFTTPDGFRYVVMPMRC